MQKTFHLAALFATCLLAAESLAQTAAPQTGPKATSLCVLQREVSEGKHESVRVSGVYGPGLDRTVLEDAECPSESTWVELALRSQENKDKLRKMLDDSRRAYVVVEGEFYGPPLPDPKLPDAIKKDYHPGWGHLAAFKTKLVVHAIREVKPAPTDHTNGASLKAPPSEAEHYSNLIRADLPLYPPVARAAHVNGTVEIQVTVERGAVVDAQVKSSSSPLLSTPTVANVKTWQFQSEDRTTFSVTYVYQIEGEQTPLPENPRVELDLPRLVKITARPFKPTCSDCGAQNHGGSVTTASVDPKDGSLHLEIPVAASTKPKQP